MATMSGMSGDSSIGDNPLLQSTFSIKPAPSIAFAVVYGIFMLVMILRLIKRSGRKFAYVLMVMVAAIRVVTFVMRYEVTKTNINDPSFNNIAIAAGVLIIAGFFLFLEAILELIVQWFLLSRQITLSSSTHHLSHTIRHMTLAGISGIGIAGSVILAESFTQQISQSTYNTANDLRIASGALFLVVTAIMLGLVLASTFTHSAAHIVTRGLTTSVLVILALCCTLESLYRLISAVKHHGWIVKEQAVDVLVFMPELIAFIIFAVIDFSDMGNIGVWNGRERKRTEGYVQNGSHHHNNKV